MPRSLTHFSLALMLLVAGEAWALGLGDIRLESALNEPLRAEIQLLSASPEELSNLQVALASSETFARYGLDRPFYLQDMRFEVVRTGRPDGNFIRVRSTTPMTEPFLTFLVEATWSRGRLLREYTVLLDPPTFAPPVSSQPAPQVQAPTRTEPADSGRIEREPAPQPAQAREPAVRPAPSRPPAPKPQPVRDDTPFDASSGGDYQVARGETLWGIATAMRPDSRLSMSQTMLAIYEANPGAFGGNINLLREGARLTIPSADDIYRIDRGNALAEVERQNSAWDGSPAAVSGAPVAATGTRPSLTLVPPDEEPVGVGTGSDQSDGAEPMTREQEILERIAEIEAADVPTQRALIEVRSNELANLRQELAEIRGEVYEPEDTGDAEPFVDETPADAADDLFPEFDEIMADDSAAGTDAGIDDEAAAEDDAGAAAPADPTPTTVRRVPQPSLVDQVIGWLTNTWVLIIGGALLAAAGLLVWFFRRGGGDEPDAWGSRLDADDIGGGDMAGTESMRAPARDDESFVVVEQEAAGRVDADTMEVEAPRVAAADDETGSFDSLEDTFSSETAVNLDQSDPIAEADFHMAYGLYDQAADLINGALAVEPERDDLLTKLCEIYFVWGNRDAFIDAAERLQQVSGGASADWDKIVIMGQQIAPDHTLFAGAGVAGATKEVDLSFEAAGDDTGALDIDFGSEEGGGDGIDFVFEDDAGGGGDEETLDFSVTSEMPTIEQAADEATVEMPADESTVETPTIEEQFTATGDGTAEMPSLDEDALQAGAHAGDATAEIDLDDLDLDLDLAELGETEVASLDHDLGDDEATELASLDDLDATGTNEALADDVSITGKNPQVDPNATGVQETLDPAALDVSDGLDFDDLDSTSAMRLAKDETGQNPMMDTVEASDGDEEDLLAATGRTQVLSGDMAVDTMADDDDAAIGDDDKTMLASTFADDDDEDFDFAKTEALPPGTYGDADPDATGELPAVGSTDVDLDLDDLTAALSRSEIDGGDTVEQPRDDKTVEQPRPRLSSDDDDTVETQAIAPDEMSDDLQDARTMTEVGTKLDLARAYVDMGDPSGARSILEEVLDEGDQSQRQQAQQLLDSLPT